MDCLALGLSKAFTLRSALPLVSMRPRGEGLEGSSPAPAPQTLCGHSPLGALPRSSSAYVRTGGGLARRWAAGMTLDKYSPCPQDIQSPSGLQVSGDACH